MLNSNRRMRLLTAIGVIEIYRIEPTDALHSHIARIRQALDECGLVDLLHTSEPGYQLMIEPMAVDAHQFEREAREAAFARYRV